MSINFPKVDPNDVKKFAQAWDLNGIKMILDSTSLQFATDFANVVLRSFVLNLKEQAAAIKAKQLAATTPAAPKAAPEAPKSSIILTG
jgi:hypothetical protein